MESDQSPPVNLANITIEAEGHKRFLVLKENGLMVRVRIPLQLARLDPEDMGKAEFMMKPYCVLLYNKMAQLKVKHAQLS